MKLLIDSDFISYEAAFSVQKTRVCVYYDSVFWFMVEGKRNFTAFLKANGLKDDPLVTSSDHVALGPLKLAYYNCNQSLKKVFSDCKSKDYTMILSCEENYRKDKYPDYKANRGAPRPIYYQEIRDYLITRWGAIITEDGIEADDLVAIRQCKDLKNLETGMFNTQELANTIIVSKDKDLRTVPGWNYSPITREVIWIEDHEAIKFFWTQMLTGDTSDGIKGIKGIGPVKAEKILSEDTGIYWSDLVKEAYTKEWGINEGAKMFKKNHYLLHILREYP